jgi:hypothetical protein
MAFGRFVAQEPRVVNVFITATGALVFGRIWRLQPHSDCPGHLFYRERELQVNPSVIGENRCEHFRLSEKFQTLIVAIAVCFGLRE